MTVHGECGADTPPNLGRRGRLQSSAGSGGMSNAICGQPQRRKEVNSGLMAPPNDTRGEWRTGGATDSTGGATVSTDGATGLLDGATGSSNGATGSMDGATVLDAGWRCHRIQGSAGFVQLKRGVARRWLASLRGLGGTGMGCCTTAAACHTEDRSSFQTGLSGKRWTLLSYHVVGPTGARLLERLCWSRGGGMAPERAARQPDRWA